LRNRVGRLLPLPRKAATLTCGLAVLVAGCAPRVPPAPVGPPPTAGSTPPTSPSPERTTEPGRWRLRFVVPLVEIAGLGVALNAGGRFWKDDGSFVVTRDSIARNLRRRWDIDEDPFEINQIGHPYQGAAVFGLARSSGLSYWQAAAYTFLASAAWEIAGEATRPSVNDQIATGIGGSFLGEALHRSAHLLLDTSGGRPSAARRWILGGIATPLALNRAIFGRRIDDVMPAFEPAYDVRASMGARVRAGAPLDGESSGARRTDAAIDVEMEYGIPGDAAYRYQRPFDHFTLRASVSTGARLEALAARGLLAGRGYPTRRGAGAWGIYGAYEYAASASVQAATTAALGGTTFTARLGEAAWLQGTATAGIGYAGVADGVAGVSGVINEPHYGIAPQAGVRARLATSHVSLDLSTQFWHIGETGSLRTSGRDRLAIAAASMTVALRRRHGVTARYGFVRRDMRAGSPGRAGVAQEHTFGLFYTWIGPQGFGGIGRLDR
jgi:hypothetical protein